MNDTVLDHVLAKWMDAFGRYRKTDGLISDIDLALYLLYLSVQNCLGVEGDIAELGVFRGGPFALMTTTLKNDERAHAIDVFDLYLRQAQPEHCFGNDPNSFQETVHRIAGADVRTTTVRADTRVPEQAARVLQEVGENCRFFHVDGDHRLANIRADLPTAAACVAKNSKPIIVVDDTFANTMPEVTEGLYEFLRARSDVAVFLTSVKKTFICRKHDHDFYAACAVRFFKKSLQASPERIEVRHIHGDPCVVVRSDGPAEVGDFTLDTIRELAAHTPKLPRISEDRK
jgi:hypothetical protein